MGDEIVAAEGYVLAVRILEDKSTYNTIEDVTGRMLSLRAGDVLAGVLGTRRALRGYAGVVPTHLAVGRHDRGPQSGRHPGAVHLGQSRYRPAVPGRSARRHPRLSRAGRPGRPAGPHPRPRGAAGRRAGEQGAGGLRRRHLHERGQDRRRHRAGARARPRRAPGRRGQAHRRVADARRALHARRRRGRRAHLQRRRHRQHPPRRHRLHRQGNLQPARRRPSPT